jgi:diketogulonate reductase-like aldo/keto reductase
MFTGDSYRHNVAAVRALEKYAAERGMTISQLAIAWTLANPAVHVAIVGARQANQVQDSLAAADLSLSKTNLAAIEKIMISATPVAGPSPEGMRGPECPDDGQTPAVGLPDTGIIVDMTAFDIC